MIENADEDLDRKIKLLQLANLQAELEMKKQPSVLFSITSNPMVIAAVITAMVGIGANYISSKSAERQREIDAKRAAEQLNYEWVKSEFDFMLQAMRAADPDQAAENLEFLLKTKIVQRFELRDDLLNYLKQRAPTKGAYFPSPPK